jgi:histidyl-tRNA synthetase
VLLETLAVPFELDPFLVRGLDYYSETAFELESDALGGSQNALAGGGRYDLLAVEIGAKSPVPAVGFAAGIERLFLAMQELGLHLPTDPVPDLYIALVDEQSGAWATSVAHNLRSSGIRCELDLSGRSVKSQMREANRIGSRFVVVVGEDEQTTGKARIKNMSDGSEVMARLTVEDLRDLLAPQAEAINTPHP